ncbi:MAG: hypothetical protein P4N60_11695 [Verrucomicrobiae bacterium]|nr:hypothetical protein [Verrucomicrobiae bacterium]
MKTMALMWLLLGTMAGDGHAQKNPATDLLKFHFPATNRPATNAIPAPSRLVVEPAAVNPDTSSNNLIPLIQFSDVPVTTGIENLALQAGINYLLQPDLYADEQGNPVIEPQITCRWEKITARDALMRICDENDLTLRENPYTGIARIVRPGTPKHFIDPALLDLSTNEPAAALIGGKENIPLIQFSNVPLDTVLMNLIKQSGRSIELSSNLMEHVSQFIDAKGVVTFNLKLILKGGLRDLWFDPMPELSVRWENVTAEQAIVALCENYDLEIVKDADTGNLKIVPRKIKRHHRVGH